jgi:hypothetical protein
MSTIIVLVCFVVGIVVTLAAIKVARKAPYLSALGICVVIAAISLVVRNLK